jgi:CoA-disulfide reductase
VGGVAGGSSAAARLRRINEDAKIILLERGKHISFANCGLPYYIGEVIKEKSKLIVQTPKEMKKRFNIDIRTNNEVIRIDPKQKKVEIKNTIDGSTYFETYDKLVLSPGAEPLKPNLEGINSDRIFTLRNIPDTYRIKEYIDRNKPKNAVIVGAGFIGIEVAENLHKLGIDITIIELSDHVIGPLDFDMASIVHQHLKTNNVELYLKDAVKSFKHFENYTTVELSSGKTLKTNMVIMGIGVRPESHLAKEAGLKIGVTGGIQVDEYMKTSDDNIYAVGDAIEIKNFINKTPSLIPLAGPANKQGRIAANNICGANEKYKGTQGTSIAKVFDLTVALTGGNEKSLKKNNINYEKSFTHSLSHAGYYPDASFVSIKLLFEKETGKILGAQIIGSEGVDKRIDVLSTAIRSNLTVFDLEELELAYAPPYSSAKDPINMAGYTASNILKNDCTVFHWDQIDDIDMKTSLLIDVRTKEEYALGSIKGAVNIPIDEIRSRLNEIPQNKNLYLFCQVGIKAYLAYRILVQNGYKNLKNLSGGYKTYRFTSQKQSNTSIHSYDKLTTKNIESFPEQNNCNEYTCLQIDACGLQCPGPIMEVYKAINSLDYEQTLSVKATDPAFSEDIKKWCESTGNLLLNLNYENNTFHAIIKKKRSVNHNTTNNNDEKTIVVFSGDLDKALASFIIANGAAALGRKVTMFFTFWGLNILRKPEKTNVSKDFISRMFGFMMPRGARNLSLSKMNMGGVGAKMIKYLMKKKNVSSLEDLIKSAEANNINLVACNMSMDLMGIRREELLDDVQIGGVATFLSSSEQSNMSLFI